MDPSTSTQQKKRGLFEKASGTKEAVKQSADEKIPGDASDEPSSPDTKNKSMFSRFRGIRVTIGRLTISTGTHRPYFTERRL